LATLALFFKVRQIASKASVDAARTVLLANRQPFPDAKELSESSGKGEKEELLRRWNRSRKVTVRLRSMLLYKLMN
jgi:hypothetical protein